jgi:hypothetical protein
MMDVSRLALLGVRAIIGRPVVRELMDRGRRLARISATVPIGAESGSGEGIVARASRPFSLRASRARGSSSGGGAVRLDADQRLDTTPVRGRECGGYAGK